MRQLPANVCRCQDDRCASRDKCLRWLQRKPAEGERVVSASSLFPYGQDSAEPCTLMIRDVKGDGNV